MRGATSIEQGVDHGCDATVARWFKWRFPMLELRSFAACRGYPYQLPHHIVEMEGNTHVFVNLGVLPKRLIPGPLRRSRATQHFKVERLSEVRLRVSMLIWLDAPLAATHPLAKLCPSRWPIADDPEMLTHHSHLLRIESALHEAM